MKGRLVPQSQTVYTYTDAADQDWRIALDLAKGNVAATLAEAPNMYGRSTSEVLARSDSFEHAAMAIDQWVDDWNAGGNPSPVLTVDAKPGGSVLPLLLLLAFLVMSDGRGKRR